MTPHDRRTLHRGDGFRRRTAPQTDPQQPVVQRRGQAVGGQRQPATDRIIVVQIVQSGADLDRAGIVLEHQRPVEIIGPVGCGHIPRQHNPGAGKRNRAHRTPFAERGDRHVGQRRGFIRRMRFAEIVITAPGSQQRRSASDPYFYKSIHFRPRQI